MASEGKQAVHSAERKPAVGSVASTLKKGLESGRKYDWSTFGALLLIVIFGAYLRFYFDFSQSIAGGFPSLSGGSDADFYFNVVSFALGTGHQLLYDPLLNYPIGSYNPFLPFYVWMVVLLSWPISFLFHLPVTGSIYSGHLTAAVVAYSSISALSGVGAIVATYFLGKELFSRKTGLVAAALMAFMPSIVSESTAGFGVHDPFILMLTAAFFFFVFRSLNTINGTRWVERWTAKDSRLPDFQSIGDGLTKYYRENRRSLLYAALAGIILASIANAWEGYSYLLVVISLFYLFQSFVYKFKNRDTLALTSIYSTIGFILVLFAAPVYYNSHAVYPWYYVSLVFFVGTLIAGVVYTVARDVPWLTLITAVVASALILVGVLELADPHLLHSIVGRVLTAQSYFIKSPVYSTIAEAQTPPFSLLALSLGGAAFFMAFAEMAYLVYRWPRGVSNSRVLLMIWFLISAYMAVSTVRFILDATTTFVILAGEGIVALVGWADLGEVRKGFQTYGTGLSGMRKSIKIKHLLVVLFVAFVVVMPVVWTGIDAATPSNMKTSLNNQIYSVLPSFLRPPGYTVNSTSSPYYFGAFGYSLETPTTYFPDAWSFINNATSNITPYSSRPAYLSWWDYGSAVITFANVPTVADDFQQGYQLASAFLFSQNETQAISLLAARVLNAAYGHYGNVLPQNLTSALESYGINVSYVEDVMAHPDNYKGLVLAHPEVYGPFASTVSGQNVMYAVLMVTISKIGLNNVVNLYQTVSKLTNDFIGFFSVDARLFPFSATNTGVFYAPAFLGGRPMAGPGVYNIPYNYYTITATTSTGLSYPLESLPANSQVISYSLNYQPMFYNMTMYRLFMGFSAYDLTGQNLSGLPGLSGSFLYNSQLANLQPMPGWMESHFEMMYRTAYYNPWPLKYVKAHPDAWKAISLQTALQLVKADPTFSNYTVDVSPQSDFQNGIVVTEYFPGAYVNGTVLTSNGQPAKGIRATILDQWGIPHDVTYTNAQGRYSLVGMEGQNTVVLSSGDLTNAGERLTQVGTVLKEMSVNVTYSQAMRTSSLNITTGLPNYNINLGSTTLGQTSVNGHIFFATSANNTYSAGVTPLIRNMEVQMVNTTTGQKYTTFAANGVYNFTSILPGRYNIYLLSGKSEFLVRPNVTVSYGVQTPLDLPVPPYYIEGGVFTPAGVPVGGAGVHIQGAENSYSATVTSSANGSYSFTPLLPGNYTIYVSTGGYTSSHYTISAVTLNYTQTHGGFNLIALRNVELSGLVTISGNGAPYDTLYFYSQTGGVEPFSATTDSSGAYSISIGAGAYTVYSVFYSGGVPYVVLTNVSVGPSDTATAGFSLVSAYPVSGMVKSQDGSPAASANVRLQTGSVLLNFTANQDGNFSAMLPSGTYAIWTSSQGGAYLGQFSVSGKSSVDITETQSASYSGLVETAISGARENVGGAAISFNYGGLVYSTYTNLTGGFSFSLPSAVSVTADVSAFGMVTAAANFSSASTGYRAISLVAENVQFSGSVSNGVQLPSGTTLVLTPPGGTPVMTTVTGGAYSASLAPGTYTVAFGAYSNKSVEYTLPANQSSITIPVGQAVVFNALVITKYNVTFYFSYPASSGISNSTPISRVDIFSPALPNPLAIDKFANGRSLYLSGASYTIYAYSSTAGGAFAFLNATTVASPTTYSLALQRSLDLSGTVYYGTTALGSSTVYLTNSAGARVQAAVQSNGSFSVSMPSSVYAVNATYNSTASINGQTRYVQYYGETTVDLTSNMNVHVMTSLAYHNSTVSGSASWYYGLPAQSNLNFIAESTTAISRAVVTSGSGSYSVSLAPGNYTVETYSSSGTAANVTRLSVLPGSNATFNPVINNAYSVQGSVALAGAGAVPATVTFNGSGGLFSITAYNGTYSLLLPGGSYNITAKYSVTQDGTEFVYGYNATAFISAPSQLPLTLSLVPTYGVRVTVNTAQVSPGTNGLTQVTLTVNNTGDVPDVFYLSVDTNNWFGAFNPTYLVLGTGMNSSAVVSVMLTSTNPAGGINDVTFSATSLLSAQAHASAVASVQVPKSYGFSTSFTSYGSEQVGRVISFSIVVNNTGNTASSFVASVDNIAGLNEEGWKGGIYTTTGGPFFNSTYFTLQPGQNQTLTVQLTASVTSPSTVLPVIINVTQKGTNSSDFVSVPISLPRPFVPLTGITVSGQGASISAPPIITLRRAVAIFVLASLIIANVYYAKKRRLIR